MLKIRLQRVGRKNDASFRVIVTESTKGPKAGNAVEVLGFYDPKRDVSEIKGDRVEHWISVGAQVSNTVHNLLVEKKIIKGDKKNVLSKKTPIAKEIEADEVKAEDVADVPAEETPVEEKKEESPAKEKKEEVSKEDAPAEEVEKPVEEKKDDKKPTKEDVSAEIVEDKEEKKEETK
ncbi:MAG: 30S ribosomal protein S16 [Candidatus Pacebacteria bacterium]|nr:30S ribosomal protein S16 [Candidatus Paceibacterota bacterium]